MPTKGNIVIRLIFMRVLAIAGILVAVLGFMMAIESAALAQGLTLYRLRGRTFLWIQSKNFRLPEHLKVDYLIISNNSVKSLKPLSDHLNFEKLILDSSNSYRYCEQFKKEAASMSVQFHSVLGEGAFVLSL